MNRNKITETLPCNKIKRAKTPSTIDAKRVFSERKKTICDFSALSTVFWISVAHTAEILSFTNVSCFNNSVASFPFFVRDCYFWAFSWLFDFVSVFNHQLSDGLVSLSPRLGQFCPLGRLGPLQQLLLHSQTGLALLHLQLYARLLRQMHVFFWFVIIRAMLVEFTSKLPLYHHLQNLRIVV